jgi:hypothetical protein
MRTFGKWVLVLAVPVVWVTAARSAELSIPTGATVKLILLRQKSVQKELGITPAQVTKIMAFTNKEYAAAKKAMALDKEKRREIFKALAKANVKFLADTLKPDQQKRLTQIGLQLTGLVQLQRKKYIKLLKLTPAQQKKVKAMWKAVRPKVEAFLREKDAKKKTAAYAKHRKETREKIMALLTDEQKAAVRKIVGKRFEGKIEFEKYAGEDEEGDK